MECKGYRSRHWTPISDPDDPGNVHPPSIYVVLNWAEELGQPGYAKSEACIGKLPAAHRDSSSHERRPVDAGVIW